MIPVYRVATRLGFRFERVMAEKVTDQSVFIGGNRQAKVTQDARYFLTFDAAHEYAMRHLHDARKQAERDLAYAEERIGRVTATTDDTIEVSTSSW